MSCSHSWRGPITDDEMVDLVESQGGRAVAGWWDQIRAQSLGWVAARDADGVLVGFANVAWDGGDHALLLAPFYVDACGVRPTAAGLVHLPSVD